MGEFVNHYLNEGVDSIIIIDDESNSAIYDNVSQLSEVEIVKGVPFANGPELDTVYKRIRARYDWLVVVDMDEYVTTKQCPERTLKEELLNTFKNADCVKIPWVMMAFNGLKENPACLLETNTFRWDHDLRHEPRSGHRKLRCRFESIEVKCAFRTRAFEASWLHHPKRPAGDSVVVVDSVGNEPAPLDPFHSNLRERDIQEAHLLCYHFRVTSQRQCNNKLRGNKINAYQTLTADELRDWDYPERVDDTLSVKSKRRPKRFD
ncbi:MAG: glycosyltransferase family 2 protein [Myxococcota bacterium]